MELHKKKCVPCRGDIPPFSKEQIDEYLKINIIKDEEELNHLTQKEKELTKNAAKENTQV